ncbi:MAG: asparaginase domain-containing protein, partial [Vicinamibacterales bacterium]
MRHARLVAAAAGLVICLALADIAAAQDLPRVRLVATGGTISNRAGGRLTADELVSLVPDVRRYARPEAEQFSNTASSDLTLGQWLALSRRLNELYSADAALGGIVVTSGTDTLEELAYFLHLTVRDARPVVVVGSMRNPSTTGYEGAANLLEGFRVAA